MRSVYIDMEYFSKISHRNSLLISNYIPAEKCANAGVVKMEKFQNERLEFLHFFLLHKNFIDNNIIDLPFGRKAKR